MLAGLMRLTVRQSSRAKNGNVSESRDSSLNLSRPRRETVQESFGQCSGLTCGARGDHIEPRTAEQRFINGRRTKNLPQGRFFATVRSTSALYKSVSEILSLIHKFSQESRLRFWNSDTNVLVSFL